MSYRHRKWHAQIYRLLDFLLPPHCIGCQTPIDQHHQLCSECWSGIDFIQKPICAQSGLPLPYDFGEDLRAADVLEMQPLYHRARSAAYYRGKMRELIHDLKYHDRHEGVQLFTRWMMEAGKELIAETDVIIPVPLYRWRLWQRKFNQSALLAAKLGQMVDKPVLMRALTRHRATKSQIGLSAKERKKNVTGAFSVNSRDVPNLSGQRILLIDDVMTSGATIEACIRPLLACHCQYVNVLTLARVIDNEKISF